MAMTYTTLKTRLKTRLRADLAVPAVANLNDASIATWANEKSTEVIYLLKDKNPYELQALTTYNATLTFNAGMAPLSGSGGTIPLALRVDTSLTKVKLLSSADEFAAFDGSNFMNTPTARFPVGFFSKTNVYVKPTAIDSGSDFTSGRWDYIDQPPEIAANGTFYGRLGDQILLELIAQQYFIFLEEFELANLSQNKINELIGL